MSAQVAPGKGPRSLEAIAGGAAAVLGGLAWTVKGVAILAGGDQPPLLFEAAPTFFGVGLIGLALSTQAAGRRRTAVTLLAAVAVLAALAALVTDLVGEVAGAALAVSSLALLAGLVTLDRQRSRPACVGWWIGVAMLPALLVGGMLSEIDERLLEIPLVGLGIAWMVVGGLLLGHGEVAPQLDDVASGGD